MNVYESSLTYITIAAVGPIAAAVTEAPQVLVNGATTSILGAVGLAVWKLVSQLSKFLQDAERHRQLEVDEWKAAQQHRVAEREMWAKRSPGP